MEFNLNGTKTNFEKFNPLNETNHTNNVNEKETSTSIFIKIPSNTDKGNNELNSQKERNYDINFNKIMSDIKMFFDDVNTKNRKKKLPKSFNPNSCVNTDFEWSEAEFAKVLDIILNHKRYRGKFKNSVLQGKAKAFLNSAKKYKIDPRVLVAVAMLESERGISPAAKDKKRNNVGGLAGLKFKSVEESIDSIARTINTKFEAGYTTINKIGIAGVYCKKEVGSDWVVQANSYLNYFNKYYKA